MVHTSFARVGSASGTRTSARNRLRLLRCIASPSSRYSRYTLLWLTRHRSVPSSGLPLFCQHHLQRVEVQRLLRHDVLQPSVLFLQLAQSPGLVHFQAPVLRLPVVERGVAEPHPAAEVFHRNSCLRLLQHPDDLLFTKAAPFHGASPLVVLYPEKLSFGWTKFRGAGHSGTQHPPAKRILLGICDIEPSLCRKPYRIAPVQNVTEGDNVAPFIRRLTQEWREILSRSNAYVK